MRAWRWVALAALGATSALAQDLGDGHLGDLTVDTPNTILNKNLRLLADVSAGATQLVVPSTFAYYPSDLLMLIRIRGGSSDGSESAQAGSAGDVFFTRISHVNIQGFEVNPPLDRDWHIDDTEIVYVPEYRNLTVTSTGSIYSATWDGTTGGVVALLVTGELRVDGTLNADGIGFQGGSSSGIASGMGCLNAMEPAPNGAQKGEGLLPSTSWPSLTGLGRNANGGGGGVCQSSGGGGGGNFGKGGTGAASTDGLRAVGGEGGAAVATDSFRPLFGGGGGAGTHDISGGSSGGAGGGIVIVRAGHLSGNGLISARGADAFPGPPESPTGFGSAGGGGAGGSIDLISAHAPTCHVSVKGGNGGSPSGGGGAGGRVRFSAPNSDGCSAELFAGVGATSADKQGLPRSAQEPGYIGSLIVETLPDTTMKVPGRYEFGTLGCSTAGGATWVLVLVLLPLIRRKRFEHDGTGE